MATRQEGRQPGHGTYGAPGTTVREPIKAVADGKAITVDDVVRYRSDTDGGGTMRIESIRDGVAICVWWIEGKERWGPIPVDVLRRVGDGGSR